MNIQQAAVFQYSVNYFLGLANEDKAKKCIWKVDQQLFTAYFYDANLFNNDEKKQDVFNDRLKSDVLHIDSYGTGIDKLRNNLPLLIDKISNFVSTYDLSKYNLSKTFLAKNVSFLGRDISGLDFYLFPENSNFEIVSITSSETLDQNV